VRVVAVSVDGRDASKALEERLALTFRLGVDDTRALTSAFGVLDPGNDVAWPALFLLDEAGVVRWRSLAETYPVRPAWRLVLGAVDQSFPR
jgi:peroxiredoxin